MGRTVANVLRRWRGIVVGCLLMLITSAPFVAVPGLWTFSWTFHLGMLHYTLANEEEAGLLLTRAALNAPVDHWGGLLRLGWGEHRLLAVAERHRIPELGEAYRRIAAAHPEDSERLWRVAIAALHHDRPHAAKEALWHLASVEPESPVVELYQAKVVRRLGQYSEAAQRLENLAAEHPDVAEVHVELARLDLNDGNASAAESRLRHALELLPSHLDAAVMLERNFGDAGHRAR